MRRFLIPAAVVFALTPVAGALVHHTTTVQAQSANDNAGDVPIFVIPKPGPFSPERIAIPQSDYIAAWARSGHSDSASVSFSYWNEAGVIPPVCSVCHSGAGFRSFHGLDGSEPGLPAHPVPVGGVVDCETCHNTGLASIAEIALPSGVRHPVNAGEVPCMTCHQGRSAGATVGKAIEGKPDDTPDPALTFINPHYATAAAALLGGYGGSGYHYAGKTYSGRFLHARPVETCVSCHDPHSLQVAEETCLTCHASGTAADIRISRISFDGTGDLKKGIRHDIAENARRLKGMLEDYASKVAGVPMLYDGSHHPYFFTDANGDGVADQADGKPVPYNAWTPRLLKAAYNWKFVGSDKGIHVHNPHYALELLHDSTEDLAGPLGVDFSAFGLAR
ncbi:cytochrome C [Shinella granuli]|uniref:Uncharacterized protein n=1 Tax=Shinella granuli TaxID=323621 RepID=A0A4V2RJ30_SHIGR|nr:cytochrome C [Shinella granuli]TCN46120.1 hypothetical protein EV665_105207 [Shinella granuli]